jgi:hypothetical protein
MILIPFFLSVSGVLVIHSHCICTGKNQTSFYFSPETCDSYHKEHAHLFGIGAEDVHTCCHTEHAGQYEKPAGHHSGCGCESPDVQFFKIKNQFTDEKGSSARIVLLNPGLNIVFSERIVNPVASQQINLQWIKYPPPQPENCNSYIFYICQPKIPHIA